MFAKRENSSKRLRPIQTYSVLKYNNSHHSIPISYDISGVNIEIDKSQIPPEMYDSLTI